MVNTKLYRGDQSKAKPCRTVVLWLVLDSLILTTVLFFRPIYPSIKQYKIKVPPRPVRDVYWFDLFSTNKRKKKLDKLDYLVFHYGSDDPDDCYSFIPQDEFKNYEVGLKEGYDKLPESIQTKLDAGETLTEEEAKRVRGLEEMKEDAAKDPSERKRGGPIKERHEEMAKTKAPPAKRQKRS